MDQKDAGTTDAAEPNEQTLSMQSLQACINEISRQMVHQLAIMKNGKMHADMTIENGIISDITFHAQSEIKI